ncbi:MAG: adenosylmethionine--8-amino-7-oxononanoate transaminase [Candidatus Omnitrophica bacterium]|nr:adenosylmethionine--8-amino-7-oxononanoate transaminase [Candidatus Omnitrophota bacterium]
MDKWIKKDLKYVWHPYTQMKDCRALPPVLIERAKGFKLYDAAGKYYYDTISSWWCNVHGHNHPKIKEAIKKQADSLEHVLFAGFTHKPAILLAEKLVSIAPEGLRKVFFSDNGSTSVEIALKLSFQYWNNTGKKRKKRFISLDHAYHGDTIGGMSVSGVDLFNEVFSPLFFPSYKAPSPYCYRCPVNKKRSSCTVQCIDHLENLLRNKQDEIAALILEPLILAAGGMIVYPVEYLKKARKLTKKYGVHLILDEVATGFGRTGKMFASEYAGVRPDFMCISKGITAGYMPLGATLTTDKVYKAFYSDHEKRKTFYHGHTYTANPLACAAALASLDVFKEEDTLKKANELIPVFHKGIEGFRGLPFAGDVRYIGMIGAIELVRNKKTKRPFDPRERIGVKIYRKGLKRNLILRPLGDIVYLFLPLSVKRKEIDYVLGETYDIISSGGGLNV